jgi:hypothetical protein
VVAVKELSKVTLGELIREGISYLFLFCLMFAVGSAVMVVIVFIFSDVLVGESVDILNVIVWITLAGGIVLLVIVWITLAGGIVLLVPLSFISAAKMHKENELLKEKLKASTITARRAKR